MLQANEIRIGNWINDQEPYEFQFQAEWRHIASTVENGARYRPIPLTEDWLLKFGFERVKDKFYDNYKIEIGDDFNFHSVQIRDGNYFYSNDESDAGCYVITEITYVHQLQNLHFALTGTELTIKEPVNNIS